MHLKNYIPSSSLLRGMRVGQIVLRELITSVSTNLCGYNNKKRWLTFPLKTIPEVIPLETSELCFAQENLVAVIL